MCSKQYFNIVCINVMHIESTLCSWGGRALFKSPVAEGKKLFRWREVLVLMERSLLPERRGLNAAASGPLLCFYDEGADVLLPFEVLGDDGAQEAERLHSRVMGAGGAAFFLKSTTISNVLRALSSRLLSPHQFTI